MKKRFSLLVLIVAMIVSALVASLISFGSAYNYVRASLGEESGIDDMDMLKAVDYAYRNYYYGDIDEAKLEKALIDGYISGTGDKYGEYMDVDRVAEFTHDNNGENVGVGISVVYNSDQKALEIVNVTANSPAEKAGVAIGDLIVRIGGEDAVEEMGYYEALEAMAGEAGSEAVFTVLRQDEYIDFNIIREVVVQENAKGYMHSDAVTGVIRIEEFDITTPSQFKSEIERLQSEGATRFVFDVRNNPGGDLESIVEVLDFLLPEGPIIRIDDKEGGETTRDSDPEHFELPMAVLVNGNTASAAELFASALQDYEAATLVGKTTYGKGSMQTIVPLIDGSALRITYRMYKPPFSDSYNDIGVVPDIDIDMADDVKDISLYKIADEQDTQLMAAIEFFNNGN